jgi:plasmid stabilization system protein ParE
MAYAVVYSRRALRDLERIERYIAGEGHAASARSFVEE